MNNIFSAQRFGRYLAYDLTRKTGRQQWLNILACGLIPIIFFVFSQLFALIISKELVSTNIVTEVIAAVTAYLVLAISLPLNAYGIVTDRRLGTDWITVPVSAFEKWLSIVLISVVIAPLATVILFVLSDGLLSLIFPSLHPDFIFKGFSLGEDGAVISGNILRFALSDSEKTIAFSPILLTWANWCELVLAFILGSMCFKKGKFIKTCLCITAFLVVVGSIGSTIATHIDGDDFLGVMSDPEAFVTRLKLIISALYIVLIGAELGGIYWRVKTIKH